MIFISHSPNETEDIAKAIAKQAKSGDIFCLSGDLGAGKTVFARGFCQYFNVDEFVTSPTFTILNIYQGDLDFYHFDMYRIEDIDELYNIGYEEYFFGTGICLVEWAENVLEVIPKDVKWIKITKDSNESDDYRKIEIVSNCI